MRFDVEYSLSPLQTPHSRASSLSIILHLFILAVSLAILAVVATFLIRLAEVLAVSSDYRTDLAYVRQTFVET